MDIKLMMLRGVERVMVGLVWSVTENGGFRDMWRNFIHGQM